MAFREYLKFAFKQREQKNIKNDDMIRKKKHLNKYVKNI